MVFPIVLIFLPRLWSVSRVHGYITPADFIRGRYGSRGLALAVAITGILALMPYIALQLVGIQAVLVVMGVGTTTTNTFLKDLPLIIAFLVLAIFTYVSGLRAPAMIAFIKDTLIYVFVLVAVFYIPTRLGGWSHIFGGAQAHFATISPTTHKPIGTFIPTPTPSAAPSSTSRRWPSARPSRCSSTRTRSPGRSPPSGAARSSGTWSTCRPTRCCSR